MKNYSIIDHTADIGIAAYGKTFPELFMHAAEGMTSLITDSDKISCQREMAVSISNAHDREDLLIRWLQELLFLFDSQLFLCQSSVIEEIDAASLSAKVSGEIFDEKKHEMRMDIKAVTYHGLEVRQTEKGMWEAKVLFDI